MNILHISPNFNYCCGVSKYVFSLLEHYSKQPGYNIYFITNGGDAISKLGRIGVNPHIIKFNEGIRNTKYFIPNLRDLMAFCKENQINIIHTHHRYPELISVLIAKRLNIKTITTAHSIVGGYRFLSYKSDKIIAVSDAVKNNIINKFHKAENKISTIHNCLLPWKRPGIEQIEPLKKKLNINKHDFVILFLGRINKIKGIDILITAFREVKKDYPNMNLIMVGDILDETFQLMNVDEGEDIIHLEAREDLTSFYEICDIVVLPSREESFPYVMLETGYVNKPLIASNTGGIAEFIYDNVNGFLFETGKSINLIKKIKFVIENSEKAKKVAEQLHQKVNKYCNCENYFIKLEESYHQLMKS